MRAVLGLATLVGFLACLWGIAKSLARPVTPGAVTVQPGDWIWVDGSKCQVVSVTRLDNGLVALKTVPAEIRRVK